MYTYIYICIIISICGTSYNITYRLYYIIMVVSARVYPHEFKIRFFFHLDNVRVSSTRQIAPEKR